MTLDPRAARRKFLAHVLTMAEHDEAYARWAAQNYERIDPETFTGLADRFDTDLSRRKADAEVAA